MNKGTLDETDLRIIITNLNDLNGINTIKKKGPVYPSEGLSHILEFLNSSKEKNLKTSELPIRTRRNRAFVLIAIIVLSSF